MRPDDRTIGQRAATLVQEYEAEACRRTDRQFAVLMMLQWLAGIAVTLWISPRTWVGADSQPHPHFFAAVFLGAAINLGPALVAILNPGAVLTRHVIAVGQAMSSALLIHLTGGRIETHFHIFGSLAFLAFYRDWRVLVTASAVVALDHFLRGQYWPISVYGTNTASHWNSLEHVGWVIFEDIFLVRSILQIRHANRVAAMHEVQIESANHAKSSFLAAMSHDLRTPLNGILGMNDLLLGTKMTERQREFVEASHNSGKLLLQLINDILDLSKIESGKLELDLQESSVETLVYDVVEALGLGATQKGLTLKVHVDPGIRVKVLCDANRLRQILVNLIGNAIKFTATGEITVKATCTGRDERLLRLRFAVNDTGIGIPQDRRDPLFAPFTQVDRSTTRRFGGTGLGLAICKQLVELMDGSIGLESQIGIGSTFWFELPLTIIGQREDSLVSLCQLVNARVLVVEEAQRRRHQVADCLNAWGCQSSLVSNDDDARQVMIRAMSEGTRFDVALIDLPSAAGDRAELIDELVRRHGLPVIAMASRTEHHDTDWLRQRGIRHLLRDPVRPSALCDALMATLAVTASPRKSVAAGDAQAPAPSRLTGHVLVAEDNRINQMYVSELLKFCGCTCDVVSNGDEVLEAMQRGYYDLILMDCQMPEMDGFTASREIRRRINAKELAKSIPIIALTANVLKGDREHCLAAGMDDYLAKPIQAHQLRSKLEQYLPSLTSSRTRPACVALTNNQEC